MKTNVAEKEELRTHEGAKASNINPEQALRRSVMTCMLWEDSFYESGEAIAERIAKLIPKVAPEKVASMAIEARRDMKLRHAPLLMVREMARHKTHRHLVAMTLSAVIQRADELAEFVSIYWKEGKKPLSAQVKKGLAKAFTKFSEYALAKYNLDGKVKLRDVLFLCHAKPKDLDQGLLWKKLINRTLAIPDTWEVALSAGGDKREIWERLLREEKLGALALLRNLRNMTEVSVERDIIRKALEKADVSRVLPFRFITAAKYAAGHEPALEQCMFKALEGKRKLPGTTVLVVDVSGSMVGGNVSRRSELSRLDAACSLAILAREVCEDVSIYATAGYDGTRIHSTRLCAPRRGFAMRDIIMRDVHELGGGGIFLVQCLDHIHKEIKSADRVIVFTDEQDCDLKCNPSNAKLIGKHNYIVNISAEKNGIAYDRFTHINGWSEAVLDYILASETDNAF